MQNKQQCFTFPRHNNDNVTVFDQHKLRGKNTFTRTIEVQTTDTDFLKVTHPNNLGAAQPSLKFTLSGSTFTITGPSNLTGGTIWSTEFFQANNDFSCGVASTGNFFTIAGGTISTTINSASSPQILIGGAGTSIAVKSGFGGSSAGTLAPGLNYANVVIGTGVVTEASSSTHTILCNLGIRPLTVTNGSATTTDATTVYIEGAATGITPTNPATSIWVDAGISRFDGVLQLGVSTSAAASLTLDTTANVWVFTGTTTTWTLPAVTAGTGIKFHIKNRGSGAITLNSSAGGNDIYNTAAANSLTINAGEHYMLILDGTYFLVC